MIFSSVILTEDEKSMKKLFSGSISVAVNALTEDNEQRYVRGELTPSVAEDFSPLLYLFTK